MKPCREFAKRGHCRFGARCRFNHASDMESLQNMAGQSRKESTLERSLREWTYMMPRSNKMYTQSLDFKSFFQAGYSIIEAEDVSTRQLVVTRLSEEGGLQMILALTQHVQEVQGTAAMSAFKNCTLPFFRIISHSSVLSSLLLESQVAAIYTFLFGVNGLRGVALFQQTATALITLIQASTLDNENLSIIGLSATLAVLDRLIEINQTAQVIEAFTKIVESISSGVNEDVMAIHAIQCLTRIKRRLNIGSALPYAPLSNHTIQAAAATFEMAKDLPGSLSPNGPRHDNDHADIIDIQILPTTQEIASPREEYLPMLQSTQSHLLGLAGLLDRQFRLLREDTVGQLRDAVREEITKFEQGYDKGFTEKQNQGVRKVVYHNVRFLRVGIDRRKGLLLEVDFDQPIQVQNKSAKLQEDWWRSSKLLQVDSLVCFVDAAGRVIFLSVCDPIFPTRERNNLKTRNEHRSRTIHDPSLFKDKTRASVLLSFAEHSDQDVAWVSARINKHVGARQRLVEFPGVLLPSFRPTLQGLQRMSRTLNLPFADLIAPDSLLDTSIIQPPAYSTRGFSFNLEALAGTPLTLTPGHPFDFSKLDEKCTLDEAQQLAVIQALVSGLALIQGPPGTGKSYTGVAILKTLLQNREAADLGPIICVCYTNHALDQLLEHLVTDGVEKVIRLGSRSKSEILQNVTIAEVRKEAVCTRAEKSSKWTCNQTIDEILDDIEGILPGLHKPDSWSNIQAHLEETAQEHLGELFGRGVDEDGFREVRGKRFRAVNSWLQGASRMLTSDRPVSLLLNVPLQKMSVKERHKLHSYWIQERTTSLTKRLLQELEAYSDAKIDLDNCNTELDLRCLEEAHIIGVTCSGLARNLNLLERVGAKVMLCEEAGEVLEAHTLTALLPGIEHAILIGDHEQLRPQINNYELQSDNPRGKKYSLDISLFERLVKSHAGATQIPLTSLKTQRRMHPSISELVRVPLYPDLIDHSSVAQYPEVDGMRKRLYWLDHRQNEDQRADQTVSQSRTNSFEVEMVAALVSHLVRQGTYGSGDIAVITPYLGQLQKIRSRLANAFEIVVGDRDQEDLETQGLEVNPGTIAGGPAQVQKTTLLNALRIATVDNFQGEEAKVIVISLVRSNEGRQCGFLKTSNRINVLLSRARHGMYIIGNSETARPVQMWDKVLTILERDNNIGESLALCCPRHKDTSIEVSVPDDFVRLAPEGGCAEKCKQRLPCGHACVNMCHSEPLHNATRCLDRCPRTKKGCEHECPKVCGDRCDEKCQALEFNVKLPCNHIANKIKCYQAQQPQNYNCKADVQEVVKACRHMIPVACHQLPLGIDHPCSAQCGLLLPCGHSCTHKCSACNKTSEGLVTETTHLSCETKCGRPYTTCGHSCQAKCHGDELCPPCISSCKVSCSHSKCSKPCNEPCAPCAEDCSWSCPHQGTCSLPCAIPCDRLPCSERCPKKLACGHQCPSVCGELCPDTRLCHICAESSIREMVVDFIEASTYAQIDLDTTPCIVPLCGHILTLESMDGHMSMSEFYNIGDEGAVMSVKNSAEPFSASGMKSCPTCRASLGSLNRYNRISRRALIDESTKKFIVWANLQFLPLVNKMEELEACLRDDPGDGQKGSFQFISSVSTSAFKLSGTCDEQFSNIRLLLPKDSLHRALTKLRKDIRRLLILVDEREQPFGRIHDLAQDARRHRGVGAEFEYRADVLQTRHRLLTTVLLIRCDYTILVKVLESREGNGAQVPQIDLSQNRSDCEQLFGEASATKQPAITVEGHMYWARFVALERKFPTPALAGDLDYLLGDAFGHLSIARNLCEQFPSQTAGMLEEIDDVEKMLRGSTFYLPVSNEEKASVYAAMAKDFRGTGHWYYCENRHPFTVGECGMPMETSRCPQCGAPVGGNHHQAVDGVSRADDLDQTFGALHLD